MFPNYLLMRDLEGNRHQVNRTDAEPFKSIMTHDGRDWEFMVAPYTYVSVYVHNKIHELKLSPREIVRLWKQLQVQAIKSYFEEQDEK